MRRLRLLPARNAGRVSASGGYGSGRGVKNIHVAGRVGNLEGAVHESGESFRLRLTCPPLFVLHVYRLRPGTVCAVNEVCNGLNRCRAVSPVGVCMHVLSERTLRRGKVYHWLRVHVPYVIPFVGMVREILHFLQRFFKEGVKTNVVTKQGGGRTRRRARREKRKKCERGYLLPRTVPANDCGEGNEDSVSSISSMAGRSTIIRSRYTTFAFV